METNSPKLTRAEQNRINAQKSTGPRTPEGKPRSSANAVKYGIYTSSVVLFGESEEEFMKLLDAYRRQFQPTDVFEGDRIQDLADARWRIIRMRRQETLEWCQGTFNTSQYPALAEAPYEILHEFAHRKSYQTKGSALEACRRAEARYRRDFDRAMKSLYEHRKQKSKNEAIQPPRLTPLNPPTSDPTIQETLKRMFPEGINL